MQMEPLGRFCIQIFVLLLSTHYFFVLSDGRIVKQFAGEESNLFKKKIVKTTTHDLVFDFDSSHIPTSNINPPNPYYPNGAYRRNTLPPFESLQPLPSLQSPSYPQDPYPLASPLPNPTRPQYGPGSSPIPSPPVNVEPPPQGGGKGGPPGGQLAVWCVAKPTVPDSILQRAMDYACGAHAPDCEAIQRDGGCYEPNTLLSHASFAFNSYWQRAKQGGGTCDFGGTAMLVTVDPSFDKCDYVFV